MLYDLAEVNSHIVDLKRSDWDKDRSMRDKGIYYFASKPDAKVYIKKSDYMDDASRPAHLLKFVDVERIPHYRSKFGAELVTVHDPYWPEPMVPDAEGKYQIMDAVLIKIANMEDFIDFKVAERDRGKAGHLESDAKFNADAKVAGIHLDTNRLKG